MQVFVNMTQREATAAITGPHWCFPQPSQKMDAGNQLALIEELHKEIRFIGNECKGEHVPGFCLPKRVSGAWGPGCGPSAPGVQLLPVHLACSCAGTGVPSQCAALWRPPVDRAHCALGLNSDAVSARASECYRGGSCASLLSSACWALCPPVRSHPLGSDSGPASS